MADQGRRGQNKGGNARLSLFARRGRICLGAIYDTDEEAGSSLETPAFSSN